MITPTAISGYYTSHLSTPTAHTPLGGYQSSSTTSTSPLHTSNSQQQQQQQQQPLYHHHHMHHHHHTPHHTIQLQSPLKTPTAIPTSTTPLSQQTHLTHHTTTTTTNPQQQQQQQHILQTYYTSHPPHLHHHHHQQQQQQHQSPLQHLKTPSSTTTTTTTSTTSTKGRKKWSPYYDNLLVQAVKKFNGRHWAQIAQYVGGSFTSDQCNQHWHRVLKPSIRKGEWDDEEINELKRYVEKYGEHSWSRVAEHIPTRTDVQCRCRWKIMKKEQASSSSSSSTTTSATIIKSES